MQRVVVSLLQVNISELFGNCSDLTLGISSSLSDLRVTMRCVSQRRNCICHVTVTVALMVQMRCVVLTKNLTFELSVIYQMKQMKHRYLVLPLCLFLSFFLSFF